MKLVYIVLPFCQSFLIPKKIYKRHTVRQLLPSELNDPILDIWDYNTFVKHSRHIEGITLIRHDDKITNVIALFDHCLHKVNVLPEFINPIIELILKYHIPFDYKDNINPFQVAIATIVVSILFNSVKFSVKEKPAFEMLETTFDDIAGCDEAKLELSEIVDFLKYPDKYEQMGAKLPRGVLLEGPPGTGKTLLARAVACEADVPFLYSSGSQFMEMFVGVGASRVRELFDNARKESPCVIFIDEIDAIGRQRGNTNEEREQTLNELLTNMDGFNQNEGIIVIAATNRADILDSALTRPGRFDRKVYVGLPDKKGRLDMLQVHSRNKQLDPSINLEDVSTLTSGFSGADIENLLNEASILSVRYNKTSIVSDTLMDAYEKITFGLPSAYETRSDSLLKMISYHEIGHTLIALLYPELFNVKKVTIQASKNGAGGYTLFVPNEPYDSYPTKKFLLVHIMIALGGRIAEQILYKNTTKDLWIHNVTDLDVSTGAYNDLKQANQIARKYVKLFGRLQNEELSEYSKEEMVREIENVMNFCYYNAETILLTNNETLHYLSNELYVHKTLNSTFLNNIKL